MWGAGLSAGGECWSCAAGNADSRGDLLYTEGVIFKVFDDTFLSANAYLLAPGEGSEALVVDPGAGSAQPIAEACAELDLKVSAVLLTHGHPDHVWDAAEVAGDAPVYIAEPDLYRLDDPLGALGPQFVEVARQAGLKEWCRPSNVEIIPEAVFAGGGIPLVEGVPIRGLSTPGHSEGSCVFLSAGEIPNEMLPQMVDEVSGTRMFLLAGDVLFKGAIGRTDLPGSSPQEMEWSLHTIAKAIHPATLVYPGHGPSSYLEYEIINNPFLLSALAPAPAGCGCGNPGGGCGGGGGGGGCGNGGGGCGDGGGCGSH